MFFSSNLNFNIYKKKFVKIPLFFYPTNEFYIIINEIFFINLKIKNKSFHFYNILIS